MPFDPSTSFGWLDRPERHVIAASMPWPRFAQAAPDLMGADQDVFLYKAYKDVLGKYPSYAAQTAGDCVSQGAGHALDCLECVEIAIGHEAESYKEICTEAIYGLSREIAGILGPPGPNGEGDGSFGSAGAKALTTVGAVPREVVGPYSGSRAREWGWHAVPAEIKTACAEHKLGAAALVKSCDEADAALANGYPITVASSVGYTDGGRGVQPRDADGVCKARGRWDHQMFCCARRKRVARRQYLIGQSWGDNMPSGPLSDDQPNWSFWVDEADFTRMLGEGDSWAFSRFNGFPGRPLPSSWQNSSWL